MACAGCGGPTKLYLKGLEPLNVNERKESTPVDVRVYLLRDSRKFIQATLEDLWLNDKDALGDDKVGEPRVYTVFHGDKEAPPQEVYLGELGGDVRFVGIMALYGLQAGGGNEWRMVVPAEQASGAVFELTEYRIIKK